MKSRALVADDDDAVRSMLQAALERDGFEIVVVASESDALSRIRYRALRPAAF